MVISPEMAPHLLAALSLGIILGTIGTALVLRQRHRSARRELRHSAELTESRLNQALAATQKALEAVEADREQAEAKREALLARNAGLEEKSGRLPELERRLTELRQHQEQTLSERSALENRLTALTVRSEAERRQADEQIAALNEARAEMKLVFRQLAEEIFNAKSKALNDHNKTGLTTLLNPLQEQLGEFRRRVDAVYDKELRDRTALKVEMEQLRDLNERIGADALNLTRALKGESKVRGQWGELILTRILEEAGLTEGREFETQAGLTDSSGRRFQPDVVVRLPGEKDVVIDAKVSLVAYERYYRSEDSSGREKEALKAHL